MIKGQAFGGYIDAKSGKRLIYEVVVNNVPVKPVDGPAADFPGSGNRVGDSVAG